MSNNVTKSKVVVKTPFKRLATAMIVGQLGLYLALLTPVQLLLTLKLAEINQNTMATDFGIISGLGALFAMLGSPIGGMLSDRTKIAFGRRRTWILTGVIVGALALVGIGLVKTALLIGVFWCISQLFFNFAIAAYSALLPEQVEEDKRGTLSGIMGMLIPFGPILGMVIVSIMGEAPLWFKFTVVATLGIISSCISVLLLIDKNISISNSDKSQEHKESKLSKIYPSPRKYPYYTFGLLTKFFQSICGAATTYNAVMLMQRFHYDAQKTSESTTVLSLVMLLLLAISAVTGGILSDKIRKQKPFVMGSAVVCGIALACIALASSFSMMLVGMALMGFGTGMYSAVDVALTARILPSKENVAKDLGIINALGASTQSIVPFVGPGLISLAGWPGFYGVLALSGVISAMCVIPIPEMSPKASVEENKVYNLC